MVGLGQQYADSRLSSEKNTGGDVLASVQMLCCDWCTGL